MSAVVLSRLANVRNLDQLEVRLVHRRLEALVAIPVAIGFLDHDAALEQQAFEHALDVELVVFRITHTERHVLEVAEQRHAHAVGRASHRILHLGRAEMVSPAARARHTRLRGGSAPFHGVAQMTYAARLIAIRRSATCLARTPPQPRPIAGPARWCRGRSA